MKNMKHALAILLALVMLVCATLLVACGEQSSGCTEHKWDSGKYDVTPTCGSGVTATKTYTCRLCGETMKKTVQAAAEHSIEHVVVKEATCTEAGAKKLVCKLCGFARDGEISIPSRGGHEWDIYGAEVQNGKKTFTCANCEETETHNAVVYYSDFGAKGDGKTDDADAMRDAHAYANEWGLEVRGEAGKTYYIGVIYEPIVVKTNTDWCGARIIIDDSQIPIVYDPAQADGAKWLYHYNTRTKQIFSIDRDAGQETKRIAVPSGFTLKAGQTNVGLTFDEPVMLRIENNNVKINIRYGVNENAGESLHEVILVDEQGNVDPSTPIQYDYDVVTEIKVCQVDDRPITLKNAEIITIAPDPAKAYAEALKEGTFPDGEDVKYINNYCYFNRGFGIQRSNVVISNIDHKKLGEYYNRETGEDYDMSYVLDEDYNAYNADTDRYYDLGVPYSGFFTATQVYNFTLKDSMLHGHKEYRFYTSSGAVNAMGSYELGGRDSIKITYDNLTQRGKITDRANLHGVMGTNYVRNMTVKDSYFDRIDVHQGAHNMHVEDTTLGFGILIIGGGTLTVENCVALGSYGGDGFIHLRGDYNSVFDGDVIIKDLDVSKSGITALIVGSYVGHHYSGLPNYMTTSLTVDGLKVGVSTFSFYKVSGASQSTDTNPLYVPASITVSNVTGCNSYRASAYSDRFSTVALIEK